MGRASLATLAALIALAAAPAAGTAQDPGSTQYTDPLAGDTGNTAPSTPSGGGSGGSTGSGPTASQVQPQTTAAAPAREELPRTGVDAWLLVLAGGALLVGGLALRRIALPRGA